MTINLTANHHDHHLHNDHCTIAIRTMIITIGTPHHTTTKITSIITADNQPKTMTVTTLLEKFWRISLYVPDDAIAKLNVT